MQTAYVSGALTDLSEESRLPTERFYERIADACKEVLGVRGYLPHEHSGPVSHPNLKKGEVDAMDRNRVCNKTSVLIVVDILPSYGVGIEVEMAHQSNVPTIILSRREKKISRLLKDNPSVKNIVEYDDEEDAIDRLKMAIISLFENIVIPV